MNRLFFIAFLVFLAGFAAAQDTIPAEQPVDTFVFTTIRQIPVTSVKNQHSSGTCWCFSGLALIESELLRAGRGEFDLSEMFVVHKNYGDKAKKYVRMHGETNFSAGGSFADVVDCIRDYGIVPEAFQTGLNYGDTIHRHGELDNLTRSYLNGLIKEKRLSTAWYGAYTGILDTYLGLCPDTFAYNGKTFTPRSFADYLDVNPDDYISITSFTHHPFYTQFPIEVPDNWRWSPSYNLPLSEMMQVIDNAINRGHAVAWASDVSEAGFRTGVAVIPDVNAAAGPGSDESHWLNLSREEREEKVKKLSGPVPEREITQDLRQAAFDNFETTDDHGMLIYGTAKDQNGTLYYLVKNSWGTDNKYGGTWYASAPFVAYKTTNIVVHRDAIPVGIRKKLNLP
ncbi:MAG: aminopeptidase [Dysgonamonadaceae bacterium]|jgi:aminopeptidase C|nr:aminopeptidase [Dysgonamonadaceae bacterium]